MKTTLQLLEEALVLVESSMDRPDGLGLSVVDAKTVAVALRKGIDKIVMNERTAREMRADRGDD